MRLFRTVLLSTLGVLLLLSVSHAIDLAIPSDFFAYEVNDADPTNQGYYLSGGITHTPSPTVQKPYAFIMDARGDIVWFHTDYQFDDLRPFLCPDDRLAIFAKTVNEPHHGVFMNSDYTVIDSIFSQNPFHDNMYMDGHEILLNDDGTVWSLWLDPYIVDMSQYVQGGQEDCLVEHAAIQRWDAQGNLMWEWRSGEHLDGVPYTERVDQQSLTSGGFRHLHVNSFQVLDDGNVLVSARKMDTAFLIEYDTGDVLWHVGSGPANDFTFFTDLPDQVPTDFNLQHDARLWPGNRLTVFDNGGRHPMAYRQSRGREYILDYDNMTAELVWYYQHPSGLYADITGSVEIEPNNNRLIGWGGSRLADGIPLSATEVTADNELVWELKLYQYTQPTGRVPATYRFYKLDTFTPAAEPYLSEASNQDLGMIELVCNWFGHEDEVDAYRVFGGLDPDNLEFMGLTDSGYYYVEDVDPLISYYFVIRPVDADNEPVGPYSNLLEVNVAENGLVLRPLHTEIQPNGGNLLYSATVTSVEDQPMNGIIYSSEVILPNGNTYGPLMEVQFSMMPHSTLTVSNLTQDVPAMAPEGDYEFVGGLYSPQGDLFSRSTFEFEKLPGGNDTDVSYTFDPEEWEAGGDMSQFNGETALLRDTSLPNGFQLAEVYPNPFNPTTTVQVNLPVASELKVTVFNVTGQRVAELADGRFQAGAHTLTFDGSQLASGLYFVRAEVPGKLNAVRKVMLVR